MATTTLPKEQLGVLTTPTSNTLQNFPVPDPGPNEVLVRNIAVASNPKDWKVPQRFGEYSSIEGNDIAGYVAKVGEGVTEYKGGERVAAFTKMATLDPKYGAYAEYSVAPAATTFPIPPTTSFEEASTLPLAIMTAALGLFKRLELPEPPAPGNPPREVAPDAPAVIVNGASSSVGAFAVQLAKRAGFFVVGIAGVSKDYPKSLGADVVLDYREYKTDEALEQALLTSLKGHTSAHAFDGVSLSGSTLLLARVLSQTSHPTPTSPARVTFVLGLSDSDRAKLPPNVSAERTGVNTAYGDEQDWAARFYRQISQWLVRDEKVNPNPLLPNRVRVVPGGLAGVDKGLELLKKGEVHAEKLVYRIEETPGVGGNVKARA